MLRIDSYIDNLRRDEVIHSHSRTWQALQELTQVKFDAVLADVSLSQAAEERTQITGRDSVIADTAQRFSQPVTTSKQDTLIADAALRYSRAADVAVRYDPVFAAISRQHTRNGEA